MLRQREWFSPDPDQPHISLTAVEWLVGGGFRVGAPGTVEAYAIVAIIAAKNSLFYPTAPLAFEFFEENDPDSNQLEPIYSSAATWLGDFETDNGPEPVYSYLYVVPVGPLGTIYPFPADGVGSTYAQVSALGIFGMTELGPVEGTTLTDIANTQTIPAATTGAEGVGGLWVLAGFPAGDRESGDAVDVDWPAPRLGVNPGIVTSIVGDPGFIVGNEDDPVSGGALDFEFSDAGGALRGVWLQLLPVHPPDVVPLPATTIVTNEFNATTTGLVGATYSMPLAQVVNEFNTDTVMASASTEWRAVLVDADGNTYHRMPDATLGDIVETLNDITKATLTIPLRSPAGELIDTTDPMAALEVQIWRGPVLWLWGPITAAQVQGDTLRLTVSDAPWHLTQRHVGAMGNRFGGRPPYYHDSMTNLRFETGDITGWSIIRTVTVGEFVGFATPDPDAIRVDPTKAFPSGEPVVRCDPGLDPLDNLQMYQDLTVVPPQNGRALHMVLSGWWFIPSDGGFAPNNQRMGLLLAPLIEDPTLPADYYRPYDVGFSVLDDTAPRDVWFYQQCEVDVPPGAVPREVHVAVTFPQGISYVAGLDLQVDDGLLYDESPTTIGAGLVMHAQDPAFGRDDVNIDWWANVSGDREVREYQFADHTQIMNAISALAREGWFDWWCSYVAGGRVMNFITRRRGGYRPKARIRMLDGGPGNAATITRARTTGVTSIAAQTRSRDRGNHEHAAGGGSLLTLEDVFVADREPSDYDLPAIATQRLALTVRPEVIQVGTLTGDERFLLGLEVGDTTDIVSTVPGARADGRYRLTGRTTDPARDACDLTFNPETAP